MTAMTPQSEQMLRQGFKQLNRFMILIWRLGLGGWLNCWPEVGGQIMVLVHTGRKTGLRRYTPVNYALVESNLYCTAGFGHHSDWYRNIMANPEIEVWLPDSWWAARATDVSDHPERLALLRAVLIGSGFAAYAAGLNPQTMTAAELDVATKPYRLLQIHCTLPCTGPGGPGDLAGIWPLTTFMLGGLLLARRLKFRK
jgi:deazaflavin-dependent oxidoreductase (nitroreductase family)